jgi:small subunit ribosomal protein S1
VGSRHTGKVTNISEFGVFVELEEGVDGLVHISDLSWNKKIKHPSEVVKVGENLDVVILGIDRENRRLSLGHKQIEENPWDVFESVFTEGSEHEGTVIEVNKNGAVVSLPYGMEAFCPKKHAFKEDGSLLKVDDKVPFKILEYNKNAKKILVSHVATYKDQEEQETKGNKEKRSKSKSKSNTPKIEKTTLGDLIDLNKLKDKLEGDKE